MFKYFRIPIPRPASLLSPSQGNRGLIAIFPRPSIRQTSPKVYVNVRCRQTSSQNLDLILWNALKNLRQLPIGIQRAEHMMVRVLQHETIAVLRLRFADSGVCGSRERNEEETLLVKSRAQFHRHDLSRLPCLDNDNRTFPAQQETKDILLQIALESADHTCLRLSDLRRPAMAPHDRIRRNLPRRQERRL